jgi:hypothetical protein
VDVPLRKMVQDKLITYPPAMSSALSRDVTRYINATDRPTSFAADVMSGSRRTDPLWLGFVDDPKQISGIVGQDVTGFTILLPADAVRHAQKSHGFDGGDQRPATPDDFGKLAEVLNAPDAARAGAADRNAASTVVVTKKIGSETFRAVFEVLAGKKNRSLSLLSLVIKVGR